jgi:hypothetical protein
MSKAEANKHFQLDSDVDYLLATLFVNYGSLSISTSGWVVTLRKPTFWFLKVRWFENRVEALMCRIESTPRRHRKPIW